MIKFISFFIFNSNFKLYYNIKYYLNNVIFSIFTLI